MAIRLHDHPLTATTPQAVQNTRMDSCRLDQWGTRGMTYRLSQSLWLPLSHKLCLPVDRRRQ